MSTDVEMYFIGPRRGVILGLVVDLATRFSNYCVKKYVPFGGIAVALCARTVLRI